MHMGPGVKTERHGVTKSKSSILRVGLGAYQWLVASRSYTKKGIYFSILPREAY